MTSHQYYFANRMPTMRTVYTVETPRNKSNWFKINCAHIK